MSEELFKGITREMIDKVLNACGCRNVGCPLPELAQSPTLVNSNSVSSSQNEREAMESLEKAARLLRVDAKGLSIAQANNEMDDAIKALDAARATGAK